MMSLARVRFGCLFAYVRSDLVWRGKVRFSLAKFKIKFSFGRIRLSLGKVRLPKDILRLVKIG